jgi:hypothetical protein
VPAADRQLSWLKGDTMPTQTRSGLAATFDKEMLRLLISKSITCPVSGEVLDLRTAIAVRDKDGDPALALSPTGWSVLKQKAALTGNPALAEGYYVEEN